MTEIRLVPLTEEHLDDIRPWVGEPDMLRFTRVPDPTPADFVDLWYARYVEGRREGSREAFAILDDDGTFLGVALAGKIDREARTAELGYMVTPKARGRGIATAALTRLTAWAFDDLELIRLELLIGLDNLGSKRVATKCGYTFEGVLRSLHFKQSVHEDTEIWSRVATDL